MKTLYKCLFVLSVLLCYLGQLSAQTFPAGFQAIKVAEGLNPTDMKFSPDGQYLFIADKTGKVFLVNNNDQLLATPILNISSIIDQSGERGLTHLAVDPDFSTNKYVYVYYTVLLSNNTHSPNRISRFTFNPVTNQLGSELILLTLEGMTGNIHTGGALNFGADGKLYVTTGESSDPPKAQNFGSLLGKVLRMNKDGSIPTDNPYYNVLNNEYRYIYALGFRNPFAADVHRVTGRYFIGDVGQNTWEEINDVKGRSNYGWPLVEGKIQPATIPPADYVEPVLVYHHNEGCAIVGAAFYAPVQISFPEKYVNKFFYSDYCNGTIRMINPDSLDKAPEIFGTNLNRPVAFAIKPSTGDFYYLDRGGLPQQGEENVDGILWKVEYTGSLAPVIGSHPQNQIVSVGQNATFSILANGLGISYQWLRNGVPIPNETSSTLTLSNVQLADNNTNYSCKVTNEHGSVTSNTALLEVTTRKAPEPVINLPAAGATYIAGTTIQFSGSATDEVQGNLPASALTWKIDFHHDTHSHPALDPTSGISSGSFSIAPNIEVSDTVWYRIHLTATNNIGLKTTVYRDVLPEKVTLHMRSATANGPVAIPLNMDGTLVPPQTDKLSVKGVIRSITAQTTYLLADTLFTFKSWGNGNTNPLLTITTPLSDTTITALYEKTATYTGTGFTGEYRNDFNADFAEPVTVSRVDTAINFGWPTPPAPSVGNDFFSVRWKGSIQPRTSGLYTFYLQVTKGFARFYINTNDSINIWKNPGNDERFITKALTAGVKYNILLEYWDNADPSTLTLKWSGPGVLKQVIPTSSMFAQESSLPVLFTSFTVKPRDNDLLLNWEVEDLGNVKGYAVQRRKAGSNGFETIAFINTTGERSYSYTDRAIAANTLYEYRIEQMDLDGRPTYSPIRAGRINSRTGFDFVILPNPVEANRQVQLVFTQSIGQAEILLISPEGKTISRQRVNSTGQTLEVPLQGIPAGTYYLKVIEGRNVLVKKLLVQ